MFNHDPKDDPYDPNWRSTRGKITRVEIDWKTTGISPEGVIEIHGALERDEMFIIHNGEDSLIAFYPAQLKAWQRSLNSPEVWTSFANLDELINNLKLCLFVHNQVVIPSAQLLDSDKPKLINYDKDTKKHRRSKRQP